MARTLMPVIFIIKSWVKACSLLSSNYKCKKKLNSLKHSLTATRSTSHNWNSKNKKCAITFAARLHHVNLHPSNSTFLIFAVIDIFGLFISLLSLWVRVHLVRVGIGYELTGNRLKCKLIACWLLLVYVTFC